MKILVEQIKAIAKAKNENQAYRKKQGLNVKNVDTTSRSSPNYVGEGYGTKVVKEYNKKKNGNSDVGNENETVDTKPKEEINTNKQEKTNATMG